MPAKQCWLIIIVLALIPTFSACVPQATAIPMKIALLAPFEGRYREVGYDALYAARLAIAEQGIGSIELLAVDDGDSPASAADRAAALNDDPGVYAALALGYAAVDANTQAAIGDIPTLVVGDWGATPVGARIFLLSLGTVGLPDDSFMYPAVRALFPNFANAQFESSAAPPDSAFVQRISESDPLAPPPTPVATLVYDAMQMLLRAANGSTTRAEVFAALTTLDYQGINGRIRFLAHSWVNPPQRDYRIVNGDLISP